MAFLVQFGFPYTLRNLLKYKDISKCKFAKPLDVALESALCSVV